MALLPDGGWLVVWDSRDQDGSLSGVYLQRYNALGEAVGSHVRVNTRTSSYQQYAKVDVLSDGGWVVTWESYNQDATNTYGIYQQQYDALGDAVGSETRVNSTTYSNQARPYVTALDDGGWVINWQGYGSGDGNGIFQQRYAANGNKVGGEVRVNTTTSNQQDDVATAALADGGWVVTWRDIGGKDGDQWGVFQQRYDASGDKVGVETSVNSQGQGYQWAPAITAMSDGGWIVAWADGSVDGSGYGIVFQRYDVNGLRVGNETLVNTYRLSSQAYPEIVELEDGGFLVIWQSQQQSGSSDSLYQQRFNANNEPIGEPMPVNDVVTGSQRNSDIIALPNGDWVVAWQSGGNYIDTSGTGIFQKRFSSLTGQGIQGDLDTTDELQLLVDVQQAADDASSNSLARVRQLLVDDGSTQDIYANVADISYGDTSPDVVIEIQDFRAGDNYVLVIDGTEIDITDPSQDEQAAGAMLRTDIDISELDSTGDGLVDIAVKVVRADGTQDISEDFTYSFQ
jgi:hypothetical protein